MALFTDGGPASIEDMKRYDSACEDVARDGVINLENKLDVAKEEVGQDILAFLLSQGGPETREQRLRLGLRDLVVTSPVRRWHATQALAGLYRDAYGSDVNDRYRRKWQQYEKLATAAAEQAFTMGIGLTHTPVPRAPMPTIAQAGTGAGRVSCEVRVSWVAADGTEGAPSEENFGEIGPGDQVVIDGRPPEGIAGWNVYAGPEQGMAFLQNETPLAPGSAWTMTASGIQEGRLAGQGQDPDYFVVERRSLPRW